MNKNLKNWLIAGGIITILLLPIIIPYIGSKQLATLNATEFHNTVLNEKELALVYFGDLSNENYSQIKEQLKIAKDENKITTNVVDKAKLTNEDLINVFEKNSYEFIENCESCYAIIRDNEIIKTVNSDITDEQLNEIIKKYNENIVPDNEIVYKTATHKTFMKAVNSKKVTMAIFGYTECFYCQKFRPVFNDVATEYNLDIYYFDSSTHDQTEFKKIQNAKLVIPAKCTSDNKDKYLTDSYGTPLTLFTKNGKVIDCIGGYVNKTNLVNKLQSVGMLKK